MRRKLILSLLFTTLLLSGCGSEQKESESPAFKESVQIEEPIQTEAPVATPAPVQTEVPVATEMPIEEESTALNLTDEDYINAAILYEKNSGSFILVDADQDGNREVYLYNDGNSWYRMNNFYSVEECLLYEDGIVIEKIIPLKGDFAAKIYKCGKQIAYYEDFSEEYAGYWDEEALESGNESNRELITWEEAGKRYQQFIESQKTLSVAIYDNDTENIVYQTNSNIDTNFLENNIHLAGYINYKVICENIGFTENSLYTFLNKHHWYLGIEEARINELLPSLEMSESDEMTQYYEVEKEDLISLAEDIYGKNKYNLADDYFEEMPNGKLRFGVDTMGPATFSDNMLLNAVTEGNRTTLSGIYIYNKGADAGDRNDMYKYECILEKNENSVLDGYTVVDMKVTDIDELIRNRKGNEHYRVISSSNIIVDDIENIFTDEQIESIIANMEMLRNIKMNNVTIHIGTEILYYKKEDGVLQCSREDDGGTATVYVAFECDKGIIDGYALVEEAAIALFVG